MITDQLYKKYLIERDGKSKVSILEHPLFWIVLGIKIFATFFLISDALPVSHIPPGILSGANIWILRISVLLADFGIFLTLTRWLKYREKRVLWYYWCSPVIFAISYIGGFLDLIPIALLFSSLYLLIKDRYVAAFTLLGLALATKTGLAILLVFIFIYLLKERGDLITAAKYTLYSLLVCAFISLGLISDPEFLQRLISGGSPFIFSLAIDFDGTTLYIAPLISLALVAGFLAFKRLNRDIFLMFLAFSLGTITLIVRPEPGWYSWIIPFFIYFFIKEDRIQKYPFILLNLAYFGYFLFTPNLLQIAFGTNPILVGTYKNLAFTLLEGALLLNIVWIYWMGIKQGTRLKIFYKPYLIGIAGDSASGKSTVSELISGIFGKHNTLDIAGDDMHKWERDDPHWSQLTHLNPAANNLHEELNHAIQLKKNENIVRRLYDHTRGKFTAPKNIRPKKIIVFQGLHTLYLPRTRTVFDLKIFMAPEEELRKRWKIERDAAQRGYSEDEILRKIAERSTDSDRYIQEQKKYAHITISIKKSGQEPALDIICDSSFNLDPLITTLEKTKLEVIHEHKMGLQRLSIEGKISTEEIESLSYTLIPEVWEINQQEQDWQEGLNGVLQMLLVYLIFHKTKLDHEHA